MMSVPESIKPRKLADEVRDRLLWLIRKQRLGPGDVLPSERELMQRFEVGRPAIREAMQSLQQMGIIDIRHGGRPRVSQPSLDGLVDQLGTSMRHLLTHSGSSLGHLKEARVALEAEMARIAAGRRTADDLAALRETLALQDAAQGTPEAFIDLDGEFHRQIAGISQNPIFETLALGVFNWLRAFHVDQVRTHGLQALTLAEHEAILNAIEAGDGDGAAAAMRAHLERANALYQQDNAQ